MNVAIIGNSVSSQKESYVYPLSCYLQNRYPDAIKIFKCTLGGIGSFGINFFIDRFLKKESMDLCILDTFVADLGGATPEHYIEDTLHGIVNHPCLVRAKKVFVYFYRTGIDKKIYEKMLHLYERVAGEYGIASLNLYSYFQSQLEQGDLSVLDYFYDGIHTQPQGARFYSSHIERFLEASSEKGNFILSSMAKKGFMPKALLGLSHYVIKGDYVLRYFRMVLPYYEIVYGQSMVFQCKEADCLGLIVIADKDTGVIRIRTEDWKHEAQIFDAWCSQERIQVVIFPKPCQRKAIFRVDCSESDRAEQSANLQPSQTQKRAAYLKIVHLLAV